MTDSQIHAAIDQCKTRLKELRALLDQNVYARQKARDVSNLRVRSGRLLEILKLRSRGMKFREIGRRFNVGPQRARELYLSALRRVRFLFRNSLSNARTGALLIAPQTGVMKSQFITAKQIARITEFCPRHILRAQIQRRLGIASHRDRNCKKPIRFWRRPTSTALRAAGYEVED